MKVLHALLVALVAGCAARYTVWLGASIAGFTPDAFVYTAIGLVFAAVGVVAATVPRALGWGVVLLAAAGFALLATRSAADGLPALAALLFALSAEALCVPAFARLIYLPQNQ